MMKRRTLEKVEMKSEEQTSAVRAEVERRLRRLAEDDTDEEDD